MVGLYRKRPKLFKNDFTFVKVKVSFNGSILVVDWLATATGNFGVEHNSDLVGVKQPWTFPCFGP